MKKIDKAINSLLFLRQEIFDHQDVDLTMERISQIEFPNEAEFHEIMRYIVNTSEGMNEINVNLAVFTKALAFARELNNE
jgi:hypothetical protein